jgi:uncharacterized membrane protein
MRRKAYWRKSLTITAIALVVWFVMTFVIGYYAGDLHEIAMLGYVVILGLYAWSMSRQNRMSALHEAEER